MAYNCGNFECDESLGTYEENECNIELSGGSNKAVFLECNHQLTDPSNGTAIQAEIDAGRAHLITAAYFEIPLASPVTVEAVEACKPPVLVTYNRTLIHRNGQVNINNGTFYSTIFGGKKFGGIILYECGTADALNPQVTWIDSQVSFTGNRILPGSSELQRFEGTGAWISKVEPTLHQVPANIFD